MTPTEPLLEKEEGYDEWFDAQIEEAMKDDSPGIPHEVVEKEWELQRAELLKRAAARRAA